MRRPIPRLALLMAVLTALLTALWAAGAAQATTTFELDPPSGDVTAAPGTVTGWGFRLTNDEHFLVVSGATYSIEAGLGTFADFIGSRNFFVVGNAPDASTVWAQRFDLAAGTGVGSFAIDPLAPLGSLAPGTIAITYDLYARSPLDPAFDPDRDTLAVGRVLTAAASVAVALVPEPAPWAALTAGIAVLAGLRRAHGAARFV